MVAVPDTIVSPLLWLVTPPAIALGVMSDGLAALDSVTNWGCARLLLTRTNTTIPANTGEICFCIALPPSSCQDRACRDNREIRKRIRRGLRNRACKTDAFHDCGEVHLVDVRKKNRDDLEKNSVNERAGGLFRRA